MLTIHEVADFLYDNRAPNLPAAAFAEILDTFVWCLDNRTADIMVVAKQWLDGEDHGKAEVALAMSDVFPAKTREELVSRLARVANRWPDLKDRCDEIIGAWDNVVQ